MSLLPGPGARTLAVRPAPDMREVRAHRDCSPAGTKPKEGGDETIMLRRWMIEHRRSVYVIFLVLAALNGWASYKMFQAWPLFAIPNAVMAALLALFVISTW